MYFRFSYHCFFIARNIKVHTPSLGKNSEKYFDRINQKCIIDNSGGVKTAFQPTFPQKLRFS